MLLVHYQKNFKNAKGEFEVSVILPLYAKLNQAYKNKLIYIGQTTTKLSWRNQYCGIFKYEENGVKYYFIDNEYYFKRDNFYGYFDDAERFAFFSKAAIDVMIFIDEIPDIIHVHDWQAGMLPIYLRTLYYHDTRFAKVKTVFTIHNIEYQGIYAYDQDIIEDVFGLSFNDGYLLEYLGKVNIMKGAMEAANFVTTVSPTYAEEILQKEFAHGLEHETVRVKGEGKLKGILNGIDKVFYNPAKDKALFENYDKKSIEVKLKNKEELQDMLDLPVDKNIPMIGMVSRLVSHKGLDLVKTIFEDLLAQKVQFVLLGTGDPYYEGYFKDLEYRHKNKLRVIIAFNQDLSRKIYASSDIFLMPSKSEPCGLSQMIASRYGSIPIVRETGGLKDSIRDFSSNNGNGYTFSGFDAYDMLKTILRALHDYQDKDLWNKQVEMVMNKDFGWSTSAKQYIRMYEEILEK
ncbi:MAG: glycogen synthase [Christensenellales bacterium]